MDHHLPHRTGDFISYFQFANIMVTALPRKRSMSSLRPSPQRTSRGRLNSRPRSPPSHPRPPALPYSPLGGLDVRNLVRCEATADPIPAATPAPPSLPEADQAQFNPASFKEFTPAQNYDLTGANGTAAAESANMYDPFAMATVGHALPTAQYNPYANDQNSLGGHGTAAYYQGQPSFSAPLQPVGSPFFHFPRAG